MVPFLGDVALTSGPLAGRSLSDIGVVLQKKPPAPESEVPKKEEGKDEEEKPPEYVHPNKPKQDVAGDKPADSKLKEGWSVLGESPNGVHQHKNNDLVYLWLTERSRLEDGFVFKLRYYPGTGFTLDRLKELKKDATCKNYFYTFLQLFRPAVSIDGKNAVASATTPPSFEYVDQASQGDKTPVVFKYNLQAWNTDSRNKGDKTWEYAGTERGAGNVKNVTAPYTQDVDWVKPGNTAYWANCTEGTVLKDVKKIDVEVKFESYVLLCCYSESTIPYRPPKAGVKEDQSDVSKIVPAAVIGYQSWQYDYSWQRSGNDFKLSRAYPFSKWAWHARKTGDGWAHVVSEFPSMDNLKFASK